MADEAKLKEALSLVRQATSVIQECIEAYGGEVEPEPSGEPMNEASEGGYPQGKSSNRLGAMLAVMGKKKSAPR